MSDPSYSLSDFDYELPEALIAQEPAERREQSRLMVVSRTTGDIIHESFARIGRYLSAGDCIVVNDTKVIPARLTGRKESLSTGGAKIELFLLKERSRGVWEALIRPAKRVAAGGRILFAGGELAARVEEVLPDGARLVTFDKPVERYLDAIGQVPLPPYIRRSLNDPRSAHDRERYQTVYAKRPGAVAAPTAGLHFSESLIGELGRAGVGHVAVTLHVGYGTFKPVEARDIRDHRIHTEAYDVSPQAAAAINAARASGGRLCAVGTTAARVLETVADSAGAVCARSGETGIFIYPPYRFKAVDMLLTNFHLPRSSLLMMVSAFAGHGLIRRAYREAVEQQYRFFSYGDAMLIV
ncbi:MAG TPA: tRNA preQ1(34) S-adenosylmethionine ribosyltransferase-isomerase QueA [bacterium]|nr:tRNA preQ1(34) S-adenosylmethionine ribosyltransferase-isomerase QueA [bacterium]